MNRDKAFKITKIVVVVAVACILVWDLYAQLAHGLTATVSYAVWEFCEHAPFVPFLTGFFMGHLFWSGRAEKRILEEPHEVVYGDEINSFHGVWKWSNVKGEHDTHKGILSNIEPIND